MHKTSFHDCGALAQGFTVSSEIYAIMLMSNIWKALEEKQIPANTCHGQ